MHNLIASIAFHLDRLLLEDRGAYLAYRPEWPAGRLDAWRDADGSLTLQLWRLELIVDRGGMHLRPAMR